MTAVATTTSTTTSTSTMHTHRKQLLVHSRERNYGQPNLNLRNGISWTTNLLPVGESTLHSRARLSIRVFFLERKKIFASRSFPFFSFTVSNINLDRYLKKEKK